MVTHPARPAPPTFPAPPRATGAMTGSEFLAATEAASHADRQAAAVRELVAGNVPASLRPLAPIRLAAGGDTLTVWVTRDYLAIGSDDDAVRMPLSLHSARAVAAAFGMLLPTPRLVDAVHARADLRLVPQPMTPGDAMRSNDYYRRHHRWIEAQRAGRTPDGLIAGHKKDVVITTRLNDEPDRVAIYGWHRGPGDPIQPLSLWHTATYEDYSHGLRLVWPEARLDDDWVPLTRLVDHPVWGPLLTDEPDLDVEARSWGHSPKPEHRAQVGGLVLASFWGEILDTETIRTLWRGGT